MNDLGLVEALDRLSQGVVIAIADAADGRLDPDPDVGTELERDQSSTVAGTAGSMPTDTTTNTSARLVPTLRRSWRSSPEK